MTKSNGQSPICINLETVSEIHPPGHLQLKFLAKVLEAHGGVYTGIKGRCYECNKVRYLARQCKSKRTQRSSTAYQPCESTSKYSTMLLTQSASAATKPRRTSGSKDSMSTRLQSISGHIVEINHKSLLYLDVTHKHDGQILDSGASDDAINHIALQTNRRAITPREVVLGNHSVVISTNRGALHLRAMQIQIVSITLSPRM